MAVGGTTNVCNYSNHVTISYFGQNDTPIRLFSPIFLLVFQKISHLYFYSEPSSIRNSRVGWTIIDKYYRIVPKIVHGIIPEIITKIIPETVLKIVPSYFLN